MGQGLEDFLKIFPNPLDRNRLTWGLDPSYGELSAIAKTNASTSKCRTNPQVASKNGIDRGAV